MFMIRHLHVNVEGKKILRGIDMDVDAGSVHAVMGPNGSGKSTLAYALMGHPKYEFKIPRPDRRGGQNSKFKIILNGKSIQNLETDQRAKAGLFLAMQSPVAVPGVSVLNLLRTAYQELHSSPAAVEETMQNPALARRWRATNISLSDFIATVKSHAKELHIDDAFLERGIHDGFSGGEKKKIEMLQALVLAPKVAIFDEIDTGLDVDALKLVAKGISVLKKRGTACIVITHYQRILQYVTPDVVHVLVAGKIVATGDASLAKKIEDKGYEKYLSHR